MFNERVDSLLSIINSAYCKSNLGYWDTGTLVPQCPRPTLWTVDRGLSALNLSRVSSTKRYFLPTHFFNISFSLLTSTGLVRKPFIPALIAFSSSSFITAAVKAIIGMAFP